MDIKTEEQIKGEEILNALREQKNYENSLHIKGSSQVKMTPEECKSLCSKIGLVYKEGYEDRVVMFRFTDATADRHDEVVIPSGVDLKAYKKDPVVLSQHDSYRFPIGKSLETYYDEKEDDIVGKILFLDDETDRTGMAESTFRMVKNGVLKSGSIGFRAKSEDVRLASPEEKKKYKLGKYGIIFDKSELREFSIVTIPANPNATQITARKGMYTDKAISTLKEKGISEEMLNGLIENKQDEKLCTIDIHINENETQNAIDSKLDLADQMKEKGYAVFIHVHEEGSSNTLEKAGAVLSKKNKKVINGVLDSITILQKNLEDLLNQADSKDDNDPDSSSVQKDSEQSSLYAVLDEGITKLNS